MVSAAPGAFLSGEVGGLTNPRKTRWGRGEDALQELCAEMEPGWQLGLYPEGLSQVEKFAGSTACPVQLGMSFLHPGTPQGGAGWY